MTEIPFGSHIVVPSALSHLYPFAYGHVNLQPEERKAPTGLLLKLMVLVIWSSNQACPPSNVQQSSQDVSQMPAETPEDPTIQVIPYYHTFRHTGCP